MGYVRECMQEAGADVHITGSHLTNETEYTVILSGIYIAAPTGVPPAADTDSRLAQPVTPETVYSPTLAGRRSKPRNLILWYKHKKYITLLHCRA